MDHQISQKEFYTVNFTATGTKDTARASVIDRTPCELNVKQRLTWRWRLRPDIPLQDHGRDALDRRNQRCIAKRRSRSAFVKSLLVPRFQLVQAIDRLIDGAAHLLVQQRFDLLQAPLLVLEVLDPLPPRCQ